MAEVSLGLVVLRSPDIERAARFYNLLGIQFVRERHGAGPDHLAGQIGAVVLEIYPKDDLGDSADVRLGFRVASVDNVTAGASEAGHAVLSPPNESSWGRRAVLGDPDGRRVEITDSQGR